MALLQDAGVAFECVPYLEQVPNADVIVKMAQKLGMSVHSLVRVSDVEALPDLDLANDVAWADFLHQQPQYLQRPILVDEHSAIIARPPELVLAWLAQRGDEQH